MKNGLKNVVKFIADGVFPPRCRGCGKTGDFLCNRCKKYISENLTSHEITEGLNGFNSRAFYLGFRDEILGEIIEEAKYSSVRALLWELSEVLYSGFFEKELAASHDSKSSEKNPEVFLIPMPTNRKHVRSRAMDHMDLIVKNLESLSKGKLKRLRLLSRAKDTVQVGATEKERKLQAKSAVRIDASAFASFQKRNQSFAKLYLLDDVWTTGASLTEAGKLLEKAGIKNLTLLAIVKNRPKKSPKMRYGEIETS